MSAALRRVKAKLAVFNDDNVHWLRIHIGSLREVVRLAEIGQSLVDSRPPRAAVAPKRTKKGKQ